MPDIGLTLKRQWMVEMCWTTQEAGPKPEARLLYLGLLSGVVLFYRGCRRFALALSVFNFGAHARFGLRLCWGLPALLWTWG